MTIAKPILMVHGGASSKTKNLSSVFKALRHAVNTGYQVLQESGCAVRGVEAAVIEMENDPIFNAGRGSALNIRGGVECEALITDGTSYDRSGSVLLASKLKNPIKMARLIMEKCPCSLLSGSSLYELAETYGKRHWIVPTESLVTLSALKELEKYKRDLYHDDLSEFQSSGTVGAVAIDDNCNLASATSSGGTLGKVPGRVGSSCIPGAGGTSLNGVGAVSTTGYGEVMVRYSLAAKILESLRRRGPKKAIELHVDTILKDTDYYCGAIAVSKTGQVGVHFTSEIMPWAYRYCDCIHYGFYPNEDKTIKFRD